MWSSATFFPSRFENENLGMFTGLQNVKLGILEISENLDNLGMFTGLQNVINCISREMAVKVRTYRRFAGLKIAFKSCIVT